MPQSLALLAVIPFLRCQISVRPTARPRPMPPVQDDTPMCFLANRFLVCCLASHDVHLRITESPIVFPDLLVHEVLMYISSDASNKSLLSASIFMTSCIATLANSPPIIAPRFPPSSSNAGGT